MTIISDLAVDEVRLLLAHAAGGKTGRHDLAPLAGGGPLRPASFGKTEEVPVMVLATRLPMDFSRGHQAGHFAALKFAQDVFDARGTFEGRHEPTAIELALRKMQPVVLGIDDFHVLARPF